MRQNRQLPILERAVAVIFQWADQGGAMMNDVGAGLVGAGFVETDFVELILWSWFCGSAIYCAIRVATRPIAR